MQLKDVSDRDVTYMDIPCIQAVIDFKWNTYTFWYFSYKFILLLMFVKSLLVDLLICNNSFMENTIKCQIASRSVCGVVISYFFFYEIRQLLRNFNILDYYRSLWNIFDTLFIIAYVCYIPISFLSYDLVIISTQAVVIMVTFIKIIYFLRIFQDFSFMIQMLA